MTVYPETRLLLPRELPLFAIKLEEYPVGTVEASYVCFDTLFFLFFSDRVNSDMSWGLDYLLPYRFLPFTYVITLLFTFFAVWLLAAIRA